MIQIYFYDTYAKQKQRFIPLEDKKVKMYTCGPTVYNDLTIGNIRAYLTSDFIHRTLLYFQYKVNLVMNITDVGHLTLTDLQKKKNKDIEITETETGIDRMEKAAKREGISVYDIADKYITRIFGENYKTKENFSDDCIFGKLNIIKPNVLCRVTEHIKEQIELIKTLEKKGFTYTTNEAVYFDITKYPKYEKLTGQKLKEMKTGVRKEVNVDKGKKHPADFRLWQLNQPNHAMLWDSPWGKGYPGWHIECSAMAMHYLGHTLDIHTGGIDLSQTHHINELAQSECATGYPFANYWLHNEFVLVEGKRMGKSLGNAYTLKDLNKKNYTAYDLRYLYLTAHYRSKLNFTWESLNAAKNTYLNLKEKVQEFMIDDKIANKNDAKKEVKNEFDKAIANDLNIPLALSHMWNYIKNPDISNKDKLDTILEFDKILGLDLQKIVDEYKKISNEIKQLAQQRQSARENKNFELADKLREQIEKQGYQIKDTEKGYNLFKL
jgi:cysteinyl-tRNA synthetase